MASGVYIQSATYGVGSTTVNVTDRVRTQVVDGKLNFVVTPDTLNVNDPAVGQVKTLTVKYTINAGNTNTVKAVDNETINIAAPASRVASGLQIVKAEYGYEGNYADVTTAVRTYLQSGSINMKVSPSTVGIPDPNPQKPKVLKVDVKINGDKSSYTVKDGEYFTLSAPAVKTTSTQAPAESAMSIFGMIFGKIFWGFFLFLWFSVTLAAAEYGKTLFGSGQYIIGGLTFISFGVFPIFFLPVWLFFVTLIFG